MGTAYASAPCRLLFFHTLEEGITLLKNDHKTILWQMDPKFHTAREFRSETTCLNQEYLHAIYKGQNFRSIKTYQNTTDSSGHVAWMSFPKDFERE